MRKTGWKKRDIKRISIFKEEHPLMTLQQIADHFSVSRQYIHRVLKQHDLPTNNRLKRQTAYYCLQCKELLPKKRQFCSKECSFKYRHIKVNCSVCHVPFYRTRAYLKFKYSQGQEYIYCSRNCVYKRDTI